MHDEHVPGGFTAADALEEEGHTGKLPRQALRLSLWDGQDTMLKTSNPYDFIFSQASINSLGFRLCFLSHFVVSFFIFFACSQRNLLGLIVSFFLKKKKYFQF